MTHSTLADTIRLSPQSSSRNGVKVDTFLIHHGAIVSADGTSLVNVLVGTAREVSANYAIGSNGKLWCVVDEDRRAWTSGSSTDGGKGAAWDRRSITVEIANESGAPDWGISDAAIDKAARLFLDLQARYGPMRIIGHRDLWTEHRASYATFCPGPTTVARIAARTNELADPGAIAADKDRVRLIAGYLNSLRLASFRSAAEDDGIPLDPGDTYSRYWHLVQLWGVKYRPDVYDPSINSVDGIVGPNTRRAEAVVWSALQAGTAPGMPIPAPEPEPEATPDPGPTPVPVPDLEPETPAEPDPVEEEPVDETPTIEVPVRVKLDDDTLAELLTTKAAVEPSDPVIPDTVAKPLWVVLSLIAVSAGPAAALTLIDWAAWDAVTGQQLATTVTAWAGSVAAVLGLSRFAKTK